MKKEIRLSKHTVLAIEGDRAGVVLFTRFGAGEIDVHVELLRDQVRELRDALSELLGDPQ